MTAQTTTQRQAAYRSRYSKRGEALKAIAARLVGNDKPLAAEVRRMALEGLGETVEGGMS